MHLNELDLAELRLDMRRMYLDVGFAGSMQCLYEILKSAEVLCEVIQEEREKERKLQ